MAAWISGSSRISGGTWFRVLGVLRGAAIFSHFVLAHCMRRSCLERSSTHLFARWWIRHLFDLMRLSVLERLPFVCPQTSSWVGAIGCSAQWPGSPYSGPPSRCLVLSGMIQAIVYPSLEESMKLPAESAGKWRGGESQVRWGDAEASLLRIAWSFLESWPSSWLCNAVRVLG